MRLDLITPIIFNYISEVQVWAQGLLNSLVVSMQLVSTGHEREGFLEATGTLVF